MYGIAPQAWAQSVYSGNLTIDHFDGGASMTVYFNEPTPNPAACAQGSLKVVSWDKADPNAKNFIAMMLSAKLAGRPVQIYVDGTACLWGGWPSLLNMKLM